MLPEPTMAAVVFAGLGPRHGCSRKVVTVPRGPKSASTVSPAPDRFHRAERAGHQHVAGPQRNATVRQGVGQPPGRVQRVMETGGPDARCDLGAVDRHRHRHRSEIEPVKPDGAPAEYVEPATGVVGHRVDDRDVPIGDPGVDDLDRREGVRRGGDDVVERVTALVQVPLEHEGHLGLGSGLDQSARLDRDAVAVLHVREQCAEVGLVDTDLLHDRFGR